VLRGRLGDANAEQQADCQQRLRDADWHLRILLSSRKRAARRQNRLFRYNRNSDHKLPNKEVAAAEVAQVREIEVASTGSAGASHSRLKLFEPANVAGDFLEAFAFVESIAGVVGGEAFELDVVAAGGFEVLIGAAEHLAAEAVALKPGADAEDVDVAECAVAIDRGAGHGGEVAFGFADEDDLRGEDFAEAVGPPLPPITAVERADRSVERFLPGDRLEAVDDELFEAAVIVFGGWPDVELHLGILARSTADDADGADTMGRKYRCGGCVTMRHFRRYFAMQILGGLLCDFRFPLLV